jgi:hypothetical protein
VGREATGGAHVLDLYSDHDAAEGEQVQRHRLPRHHRVVEARVGDAHQSRRQGCP